MYARIAAGLLLAAAAVGQTPGGGQAPDPVEEDPGLIISVESKLVVVPLHVYRKNNSVGGLDADAFELLEDGVAQNIAFVEGPAGPGEDPNKGRTVPTEIILLIDVSHSVIKPGLLDIRTIRSAMLDGLREDVSISLYGFACNLKRFSGPTRDPPSCKRRSKLLTPPRRAAAAFTRRSCKRCATQPTAAATYRA